MARPPIDADRDERGAPQARPPRWVRIWWALVVLVVVVVVVHALGGGLGGHG